MVFCLVNGYKVAERREEARKKLFSIQDFFPVFKLAQEVVQVALF
jgi:hypothetical protein